LLLFQRQLGRWRLALLLVLPLLLGRHLDVTPTKLQEFAAPHSGLDRQFDNRLDSRLSGGQKPFLFSFLQPSLTPAGSLGLSD
jgi:hypothetical protein